MCIETPQFGMPKMGLTPQPRASMAAALRGLPQQPLPSACGAERMLGGLDIITDLVAMHVGEATSIKAKVAGI